jgi:two-component system, chemotaxis family, protein-glutamate methylesterase/glutaminase
MVTETEQAIPFRSEPALVVIGTSLGGLAALRVILEGLNPEFEVPIAIVQHRHRDSNARLPEFLQQTTSFKIREVEDKDAIQPGQIYLAPADYHLLVEADHFSLSTDEPVCYARPSIDVLFESAADHYRDRLVGVILTGANQDGAVGAVAIQAKGGYLIAQTPATAESPVMPLAAIKRAQIDAVLPLNGIAQQLNQLCRNRSR